MITTKYKLSLADLKRFKLTPPEGAGSHWHGINHYNLVRTILQVYKFFTPMYNNSAVSPNRQEFTASFELLHENLNQKLLNNAGIFHSGIAVRTSNARRHALVMYAGGWIRFWDEQKIPFDIPFVTSSVKAGRHQFLDTYDALDTCIGKVKEGIESAADTVSTWSCIRLTNAQVQAFLCRIGDEKILPWSRLGLIHNVLCPVGSLSNISKWSVYAGVSEQIKRSPPLTQLDQLLRATELLNS
jgi:hypothetical protein